MYISCFLLDKSFIVHDEYFDKETLLIFQIHWAIIDSIVSWPQFLFKVCCYHYFWLVYILSFVVTQLISDRIISWAVFLLDICCYKWKVNIFHFVFSFGYVFCVWCIFWQRKLFWYPTIASKFWQNNIMSCNAFSKYAVIIIFGFFII